MKQAIFSQNAPAAIGPYSQAIAAGDTVYISGQLPIDPAKPLKYPLIFQVYVMY